MRLDPITVSTRLQIAWRDLCPENLHFFILLLSGGHSSLDPRLPIPNRTVKRVCADDSVHSARESRLPPGHLHKKPRARKSAGVFCWWRSSWSLPVTLAPLARPGLILFVQTFGDLANFNPHGLAADGAFRPEGTFVLRPAVPAGLLAEGFWRAV